jgi:hypothetical protein
VCVCVHECVCVCASECVRTLCARLPGMTIGGQASDARAPFIVSKERLKRSSEMVKSQGSLKVKIKTCVLVRVVLELCESSRDVCAHVCRVVQAYTCAAATRPPMQHS